MTKRQDLTIRQGETWSFVYTYVDSAGSPIDLSGFSGSFKIEGYGAGSIELGGSSGTVTLSLTSAQTTAFGNEGATGFGAYADFMEAERSGSRKAAPEPVERAYTVSITSGGGTVTRLLEGLVTMVKDVTI